MPTVTELAATDTDTTSTGGRAATGTGLGSASRPTAGHVAALDGLRGLAVLAVVIYHLPATWLPGGFLGVDVFFVLSGFLITGLLLREHQTGGTIRLRNFWRRRIRRLFPAALTMVLGTTVLASLFAKDAMTRLRGDVPASLAYVMNWRLIFQHQSYDQTFGRPPLLQHLWSLGVEEQFYLVWPLLVVAVAWWLRRRRPGSTARSLTAHSLARAVAAVAVVGAVLSAVVMAVLVRSGHDPSAVYFDPVAHATGLLLGASAAAAFPLWRRSGTITQSARRTLELLAGIAMVGMLILVLTLHQGNSGTYRGGLQLASLLSAVIVVVVGHPGTRLRRPLGSAPMVWLGQRSYSIYLWHWPIFEMTRPGVDVHLGAVASLLLRLALTAAVADLSYRFVEQPWRTGRAQRALRWWWSHAARPVLVTGVGVVAVIAMSVAVLLVDAPADTTLAVSSTPASRAALGAPDTVPSNASTGTGDPASTGTGDPAPNPLMAVLHRAAVATPGGPVPAPHGPVPITEVPPAPLPTGPVLAIGDSVLLGASADVTAALGPGTVVDAVVGRQVQQGLERLAQYRAAGRLSAFGAVVVGLGTNGPMTVADCRQFVSLAGGDRVVFVTVRVPRPWQATTNASIAACAAGVPGVTIADWYTASAAAGVLGPDRVHETIAGRALYAGVLAAAVRSELPSAPEASPGRDGVGPVPR